MKNNILFLTFDTLRYDVAKKLFDENKTPNIQKLIGKDGWEKRHTPGSFTYAAHQAFFAGFLPTPAKPGIHPRLFATRFLGSRTITKNTYVFDTPDIVSGLQQEGYQTICIGGVGFFSKQTPISSVFPNLFKESHWDKTYGVTDPNSTENQFKKAAEILQQMDKNQKVFLFINISAIHQPNYFYLNDGNADNQEDTLESHAAALQYIDSQLPILIQALQKKGETFAIFSSDHGTTYGEDGYTGHRLAHPKVWEVPYKHFIIGEKRDEGAGDE